MERTETFTGCDFRYTYDDTLFPPGTDSFLLSSFPSLKPGLRVCDLGCGAGLLGLLLLRREPALSVCGVELDPTAARLARHNIEQNRLQGRMQVYAGDLRDPKLLPAGQWDLAISNPPYYAAGSGALPRSAGLQPARAELNCTLDALCRSAARLVRWGGRICLVHKPERLVDTLCALRAAGAEPKRLRWVCQRAEAAPSLVLIEGRRGGRPGLRTEPPLILTRDGAPTPEVNALYHRTQEEPS